MTTTLDRPSLITHFLLNKPFDIIKAQQEFGVKYADSATPFDSSDDLGETLEVDDAGEISILLAHAAGINIPSNFSDLLEWLVENKVPRSVLRDENDYKEAVRTPDGYVRLCVAMFGQRHAKSNYVWLVINGLTAECHDPEGPISRNATDGELPSICYMVYELY